LSKRSANAPTISEKLTLATKDTLLIHSRTALGSRDDIDIVLGIDRIRIAVAKISVKHDANINKNCLILCILDAIYLAFYLFHFGDNTWAMEIHLIAFGHIDLYN
jgi:uncharacterized membrane protein YidH (DUF202 family)